MQENQQPPNPHISIPDPFKDYQKSLEELAKLDPTIHEFSRICYELFYMNQDGKKLWEILKDRYLLQSLVNPTLPGADLNAIYWTGFTDLIKLFNQQALQHKQRINSL